MIAGHLDRRVTIYRLGVGTDDGYTTTQAFNELATRWCNVMPMSGREAIEAAGKDGQRVVRFRFRRDTVTATLTEQDELEHDGVRYAITAPALEIGRREGVEVVATTVGAV